MSYKILIIEDEVETSKYLALALGREGFEVVCAENGRLGLEQMQEQEFDLVVLDLKMPFMLGDEVLKEIRKVWPFVPVIVYTNYGNDYQVMQKLINLGVDGFIPKGANANLKGTVDVIKAKLLPMEEEDRKKLLDDFFQQFSIDKSNSGTE